MLNGIEFWRLTPKLNSKRIGLYEIQIEGATGRVDFNESGLAPRFERIFVIRNGTPELVEQP